MSESPQAYSQYYSQYEKLNNYYKKWQGEQFGIAKSNPIERARQFEYELQKWILQDTIRSNSYGSLLSEYRTAYVKYFNTYYALMAYVESYWKMDFFVLGERFMQLYDDTEKAMKSIQKHCDIYIIQKCPGRKTIVSNGYEGFGHINCNSLFTQRIYSNDCFAATDIYSNYYNRECIV